MPLDEYKVNLENVFEGPMDLLIHLIKKDEVDIYDIPIALITEKYLAYIEWMKLLNIDNVGEFLVMASTLAHIKSRMLLPTHVVDVEQLHPLNVGQVLFCNQGDGNIVNINLVFFNQMNEKVHGTLKYILEIDLVFIHRHGVTRVIAPVYGS